MPMCYPNPPIAIVNPCLSSFMKWIQIHFTALWRKNGHREMIGYCQHLLSLYLIPDKSRCVRMVLVPDVYTWGTVNYSVYIETQLRIKMTWMGL